MAVVEGGWSDRWHLGSDAIPEVEVLKQLAELEERCLGHVECPSELERWIVQLVDQLGKHWGRFLRYQFWRVQSAPSQSPEPFLLPYVGSS